MVRGMRHMRHWPRSGGARQAAGAPRAEKRERGTKLAGGPPGEWGPMAEVEKKGRVTGGTGSGWDPLAGRGGRER
jgi:hypothetical protein